MQYKVRRKYVLEPLRSGVITFGDKTIKACKANEGKSFGIVLPQRFSKCGTAPASVTRSVLALGPEQDKLGLKSVFLDVIRLNFYYLQIQYCAKVHIKSI